MYSQQVKFGVKRERVPFVLAHDFEINIEKYFGFDKYDFYSNVVVYNLVNVVYNHVDVCLLFTILLMFFACYLQS